MKFRVDMSAFREAALRAAEGEPFEMPPGTVSEEQRHWRLGNLFKEVQGMDGEVGGLVAFDWKLSNEEVRELVLFLDGKIEMPTWVPEDKREAVIGLRESWRRRNNGPQ